MGSSTFLSAEVREIRLKDWNTNPILRLRMSDSSSDSRSAISMPSRQYFPIVGRSRHPNIFMSVDFPEPDWPMMATNSPLFMVRLMRFNPRTFSAPVS